ncbi:MAG TPA: sigma-70 family RNA polymerase sigma factor [Thermomicrobiales bacterium]|jgi:RNA polymerase sigma-70 factor (ECF subfamily)
MVLRRGPSRADTVETGGSAEDDVALVLRAIVDRRAFEPLYRKYLMPVYRRCRSASPDDESAWDATSQTFAKVLAGLDGFAGTAFAPWLFRIADNCCRDFARGRARHPTVPLPDGLDFADAGPDPEETAVAEDDRRRLEEALTKLSPRRERIVRLHLAGLKGREIAARLGLSHDLVRKEQERAIEDLGRLLGIDRDGEVRHG